MNTCNKVPEAPIKPIYQTKDASTNHRAMPFKNLIPMLTEDN